MKVGFFFLPQSCDIIIIIYQFVEFSGFDEERDFPNGYENGYLPNPDTGKSNYNYKEGKSLESLLATKNKRLQEELTKFRACHYLQSLCLSFLIIY